MPAHIKKAKQAKQAIDDKAKVVEMDDEADIDQPDFCFDVDPDDSFYEDVDGEGLRVPREATVTVYGLTESPGSDGSVEEVSTASSRSLNRGEFQDLLTSPMCAEAQDGDSRTPRSAPARAMPATRRFGCGGLPQPRKGDANATGGEPSLPSLRPLVQGVGTVNHDDLEGAKYSKLQKASNRLGGGDLSSFRDTVGAKRTREDDRDTVEASYAKAKRIPAMRATTSLKTKLNGLEGSSHSMRGRILETLLLLCEESDRKTEASRADEERRRRDEKAENEARLLEAKAEAEERRREETLEREGRACRDREEARDRTQDLLLLIGALTKKE
ncbi:Histone-lysine N-methyltransferase [Phytophthora cinnamomi]|uniref:Histone-lysine N-methyltransferase n=1 Tax=Phytophthora cinnamomi TaxID=4785 RepID=UPI00355979B8|nr:Histone-lysine N-methyltransferase [Phytophthora cinnamomi]